MVISIKRTANGYRVGDSHQNARLTDREVELARQLRDAGMRVGEIARKLEISKGYCSKILRHLARR